jgi:hypothetical protein
MAILCRMRSLKNYSRGAFRASHDTHVFFQRHSHVVVRRKINEPVVWSLRIRAGNDSGRKQQELTMKLFSKKNLLAVAAVASLMGGTLASASVQAQNGGIETCSGQGFGPAQYNACVSDREGASGQ